VLLAIATFARPESLAFLERRQPNGARERANRLRAQLEMPQLAELPALDITTKLMSIAALLANKPWVYDVIYVPTETELLRAAAAMGCITINGVTMVIHQAAVAFGLFTGLGADTGRMRRLFDGQ
jgi:shikimate 5-dehydrogenase